MASPNTSQRLQKVLVSKLQSIPYFGAIVSNLVNYITHHFAGVKMKSTAVPLKSPFGDSNRREIAVKSLIVELRTPGGINSFSGTLESIFFVLSVGEITIPPTVNYLPACLPTGFCCVFLCFVVANRPNWP